MANLDMAPKFTPLTTYKAYYHIMCTNMSISEVEITVGHWSFSRAYYQIVRPQVYLVGHCVQTFLVAVLAR